MALQEFLASYAVKVDEDGARRLQRILEQNEESAKGLSSGFEAARRALKMAGHLYLVHRPHRFGDIFRALLQKGKPIVCFYGALAEWLDYAALRTIAADGRFSLLLIGAKYDGSYDRELGERENVCFLGTRPYETLRDYAARCDVLLIPFQKGRVGDAASPVKLFEYFALQKPVVAGDTAECRRYPCVLIARSAQDYPRVIERALTLGHDPALLAAEEKEARAADWRRRAEKLTASLRTWENGAAEKKDGRP